jgi:broad specificity phosphatase PhoE
LGQLDEGSYEDLRAHRIFDAWRHGDLAATSPGAENAHAVIKRFKDAVEQIADIHRGETVLVFSHGAVMSLAVPCLSLNVHDDFARNGSCQAVPPLRSRSTPTVGASCLGQVRPTCSEPRQVPITYPL